MLSMPVPMLLLGLLALSRVHLLPINLCVPVPVVVFRHSRKLSRPQHT
jgi:hypothetical protein